MNMKRGMDEAFLDWVRDICRRLYGLGPLKSVMILDGGFTNTSYKIVVEGQEATDRYVLRCYEAGRRVEEIDFEHALLKVLHQRGFTCVPAPLAGRDRKSWYRVQLPEGWRWNAGDGTHISVFTYLSGESRYSWDSSFCEDCELVNAAALLARFHDTIYGWSGEKGCCRGRVLDLLPRVAQTWRDYAGRRHGSYFSHVFLENLDFLLSSLERVRDRVLGGDFVGLPELAIHGDYHPGNLKFSNKAISGLLDFDWARLDLRGFDVALALIYFCAYWQEGRDGWLDERRVRLFVHSYQLAADRAGGIGPMADDELGNLSRLVTLAALFMVHWVFDYAHLRRRPRRLLPYLLHGIRMVRWLDHHEEAVGRWVRSDPAGTAAIFSSAS